VISTDSNIHFSLISPDGKSPLDVVKTDPRLLFLGMAIIERMAADPSWALVAHFTPIDTQVWNIKAADYRAKNDPLAYQHALEEVLRVKMGVQEDRDRDVR